MQPGCRSARSFLLGVAVVALAGVAVLAAGGAERTEARGAVLGVASGGEVGQEAAPSCPGALESLTLAPTVSAEISLAGAGTYTLSCNYGVFVDRGANREPGFELNHARATVRWTEVVGGVPAATQSCGQDDQVISGTSVGDIGQHHVYSDDSLAWVVFDGEAAYAAAIEGLALSLLATVAPAAVPCDPEVYCPEAPSGMRLALRPFSYDVQSNGVAQYSCAYNAAPDGASPPVIQINPSWLAEANDRVPASLFCVEERAGGPSGTMDYQKYLLDAERRIAVRYLGRESSEATALALANDVLQVVRERALPCEVSGEEAGSGLAGGTDNATGESAGGALSDDGGGGTDDGGAGGGEPGGSDGSETTAAGDEGGGALADLLLGEGTGAPDAGDAAMAAAVAAVIVILTTMGTAWATVPGFSDDVAAAIAAILDRLRGGGEQQVAGASDGASGGTWVPPSTVNVQTGPEAAVADFEPGVMDPAEGPARTDPDRPRVAPLDPGLPPVDGEGAGVDGVPSVGAGEVVAPLPQEVIDRWAAVGADGQGRIFDRYGQHIGTIGRNGVVTDLNGNPVTAMTPEFGVTGFTDSQGRVIEYGEAGVPVQRTETPRGPVFTPVEDLPTATELRPDLDPGVQARWTGAGAGPEGELYGADGTVIGRIDTDGTMRTLDGRVITGYTEPVGGRLPEITLEGGERVRTPGAGPAPESVDIAASGAGDDELADLVRRTGEAQAERAAAQGAETSAGTAVGGDTEVSGPSEDTRATSGSAEGDTRVSGPDGGAPVDGDRVTDAAPPRSVETPGEVEGPRGGEALGTVLDAQGLLDQIEQEMAAGRSAQEAITRAVASTWASNAVGDVGEGVTDVRTTLLASALLPDGVNNILPDQFAANTMNTGLDAWSAIVADVAASLGEGEVNSEALDEFARQLTERSGADPWSGYAQLGEALGEELGEADMNPVTMFGNLAEDLARMDEQDVIVEQGLDAASRFEQEAFDGQHGTVLRGISEATRVATDPPDPEQFAEDATTIARVLWDDVTGSGETGGMGPGFWEEIAEHNNDAVRGVPVVGTAFDGYAQIASGIEEQGVTGFSSEMAEGAGALAEEGATLAAETYAEARDAAFDQAVATYDAIAGWF